MKSSKCFTGNIILLCSVCVVMSFLSQIFKVNPIVNLVYAASLVLVFVCYFMSGYVSKLMMFLIIDAIIAAIVNDIVIDSADYYLHILIMICTYICIEVGVYTNGNVKAYKSISIMFLLMSLILLVAYYFGPLKSTYFRWTDAICLNLHNPNAAGLWLVCIFTLLFYCSFLYKKSLRVAFLIAAAAIVPIIFKTDSRNSYFACFLLVIGAIITKFFKIKKVPNWCLAVFSCLPLIVFFFYMFVMVKNMDFWENLLSLENVDKGIDSRQGIWQRVLDNFWNCFLFGDYHRYYDSQLHNSLITIYCRFGAPATVAVCILIYRALKNLQERSSFSAALSLGAILFTGCFEASVFVGIAGLYLMLLIIPACASVEQT